MLLLVVCYECIIAVAGRNTAATETKIYATKVPLCDNSVGIITHAVSYAVSYEYLSSSRNDKIPCFNFR